MNKKQRWCTLLIVFSFSLRSFGLEAPKPIYSKGAVLIEKESKRILYDKGAKVRLPMASTTKIMTCLIALEEGNLEDVVEVSQRASKAPKVKLGLKAGEKQYLGDLLYSLMLESHNDTAVAIAEHISGSVEAFCERMTERAKELGATDTAFETPNGLDGQAHYTTPYDLAVITAYALNNDSFVGIINTQTFSIPTKELEGSKKHDLQNKNRFLWLMDGAKGVKTGYTSKAGHCFVGAVEKQDMELIGVALGAGWDANGKTRKYTDVVKMMNFGYKNYKKYKVLSTQDSFEEIPVIDGKEEKVQVYCPQEVVLPLNGEELEKISLQVTLPDEVRAPVQKDAIIGSVQVVCEKEVLKSCPLQVVEGVEKTTLLQWIKDRLERLLQ
jgi:D-alanyl-D-alanine carboxypeptidase (penicillin-binding protein 5/6)